MKSNLYLSSILLSSFFLVVKTSIAQAPSWTWAKSMGGTGDDFGYTIAIDPSGNVFSTGTFSGTVDFDPGPGIFNLNGGGIFISKLDGSGNFVWAKAMDGYGVGYSIAFDPAGSGSVYTTGYFGGTVDFDPGEGVFNLTSAGSDAFISKLNSAGNFVWAKAMGGTSGSVIGFSITLDPAGSGAVYSTGYFSGTVDFDPGGGIFNLTSTGVGDIFISKLDGSGNFAWAKGFGGANHDNAHSIAVDPAGNVYSTGFFRGTVDFNPGSGTFNLTSAGDADCFISKLDGSGNFVWAKAIGGGSGSDDGYCITVDPAGSGGVYTTGSFMGTVDFDPGAGEFNLTSAGDYDIFISKLDGSGNFVWVKALGGGTGADGGRSIAVDLTGNGNIYTAGYFSGTVDFDPGEGIFNLTSTGSYDIFISKLDGSGSFIWAIAVGGTSGEIYCSIVPDAFGNLSLAGSYQSDFNTFGSTTLTNANSSGYTNDIFIARLSTSPLDVDLISFNASYNKELDRVNLEWITASEINNDYFTIERSRDGINFQQIIQVDGAGNSTSSIRYNAFDPKPEPGKIYYRLRQTDFDGKTSNSHLVAVNVDSEPQHISIYPNPATDELTIEFKERSLPDIEVTLYNILGEIVFSEKKQVLAYKSTLDLSALSNGMYLIELNIDGNSVMKKVVIE